MTDQSNDNDIFLERDTVSGVFDIWINEEGQLKSVRNFDTALQMVIFCDRRADESEVPIPQNRRGYYGNLILSNIGYEIGSKLWLLQQARRTTDTLNDAINYVREGCQWFIDDKHLKDLNVSGEFFGESGIRIRVDLISFNNKTESRYFDLWNNTASRSETYSTAEEIIYWVTEDEEFIVTEDGDIISF